MVMLYIDYTALFLMQLRMLVRPIFRASKPTCLVKQITSTYSRAPPMNRMASTLPRLPVFEAIAGHDPKSTAVIHSTSGRRFSYGELLEDVMDAKDKIMALAGRTDTNGQRIAFLVENGYDYVGAMMVMSIERLDMLTAKVTLLSILGSNSIAVPLSSGFPANELRYILDNSEALMLLSSEKFRSKTDEVVKEGLEKKPIVGHIEKRRGGSSAERKAQLESSKENQSGMMLYTSGTTSRPVSSRGRETPVSKTNLRVI